MHQLHTASNHTRFWLFIHFYFLFFFVFVRTLVFTSFWCYTLSPPPFSRDLASEMVVYVRVFFTLPELTKGVLFETKQGIST